PPVSGGRRGRAPLPPGRATRVRPPGPAPGLGRPGRAVPAAGRDPPRPAHLGTPPHLRLPGLPGAQAGRRRHRGPDPCWPDRLWKETMISLLALEFPPIGHLVEWEGLFFKGTAFEVNKVVLLMWAGVLIVGGLFFAAGRKAKSGNLVPVGVQHIAESGIEFVRRDIIMQTMGQDGLRYAPFLTTM